MDLRERVFALSYPSDPELLMLVLGSGTKDLPVEEIAYKMADVIDVSEREKLVDGFLKIPGVGLGKALAVAAALEFGRRRAASINAVVRSPQDLLPFIKQYAYKAAEHFIAVSLSGGHEILSQKVIAVGNSNSALISPREVFFEAVQNRASGHLGPQPSVGQRLSKRRGHSNDKAPLRRRGHSWHERLGPHNRKPLGIF